MFSANTSQVSNDVKYIEDFFSAWLRTGTGSSQTVTTGIKENTGALVISKSRSAATDWAWYDTFRGATKDIASNTTAAETTQSQGLTSFNTDGHTWGTLAKVNTSGATYVDFVLKPTPKFFDVVTYTGTGSARTIAHNLGSAPGCVIIKCTSQAYVWAVYHRGMTSAAFAMQLQATDAQSSEPTYFNSTAPTSTVFSVGTANATNQSGQTYVAYLFAHNAGGFGLTGTDNVISCGSFTTDGSGNATVNLGYEPQWVLVKNTQTSGTSWVLLDNMRGWTMGNDSALLVNLSNAENTGDNYGNPTATGFYINNNGGTWAASNAHIYIAIRRGPMKTPTSGTTVFAPVASSASAGTVLNTDFPVDLQITGFRPTTGAHWVMDRLRGVSTNSTSVGSALRTTGTDAETSSTGTYTLGWNNTGFQMTTTFESVSDIFWNFRRAPGFFDEVCYTGDSSGTKAITHNLGVAPELYIVKGRTGSPTYGWYVYSAGLGNTKSLVLNTTAAAATTIWTWDSTSPTATSFYVTSDDTVGGAGRTYVAYLFASCPGVSKVFNFTGNGSSQTINCGFTGGARFVMIKRTDSTGDWYVWDSARGIVSGNDPRLSLNTTAAEVTTDDSIDPDSTGFVVNQLSATNININGASYIGLAIA